MVCDSFSMTGMGIVTRDVNCIDIVSVSQLEL